MRVIGLTVTRNEATRYLVSGLLNAAGVVDEHFVFDDCSDDDTVDVATACGATVGMRGTATPSFLDHEGRFRQASWESMERALEPEPGDWIFAIDADEALIGNRQLVDEAIEYAGTGAVQIPIPEVFGVIGTRPMIRTDGYWAGLSHPRLFAWHPGGTYPDLAMGCGGMPTYVRAGPAVLAPVGLVLLHYGYADVGDRRVKYERYMGRDGHNPRHVASIVAVPTLEPWPGPIVEMMRRG